MNLPRSFQISALESNYSLFAEDMAFEVQIASRINCAITLPGGRKVLSGWNKTAWSKVVFFVSHPLNEEVAKASVRNAIHEIAKTNALITELCESGEDHLLPLVTGIPIGCYCGQIKRVERKKDRKADFLWDYIADIKDAFRDKVDEVRELVENRKEAA